MADITKEVDLNMISAEPDTDGLVWLDVTSAPFELYGHYAVAPFRRLPEEIAEATNNGVKRNNFHTAGVRARFTTDSARIGIRVSMPYVTKYAHMALTGSSSFDLYEDFGSGSRFVSLFKPDVSSVDGFTVINKLSGGKKTRALTLNFPLYSPVDRLEIGIDAGSLLGGGAKYLPVKPIVYYGSSITQGACATRPGLCYQSVITRKLGIDHINLGFSGNARAELPIVNYMADMDMSVFVSDYDHNAPNADYLKDTHRRMYEIIRDKNPDLPYIMLSRPDFIFSEKDSVKRRMIIEDTYRFARENGDKNVYYLDGDGICRGSEENDCTCDGTHPNDTGFAKMADSLGRIILHIMRKGL
ncbi:MAG: SGNH/GDSL hydrolase family protein [Clostridia bacterium]|nr:SGNH/GDSL hydrolase family protein [Clostridia bacterium]